MHCPRCGTDAVVAQQFCRSCGFNLEKVAELLAEQPPAKVDANLARVHLRQRQLEHWGNVAGLILIVLVVSLLIYLVISEMMIKGGKIGAGLLLLLLFIGGAIMAGLQGYAKSLKQRLAQQNSASIKDLVQAATTPELEPHRQPANSITEQPTELLAPHPAHRGPDTREF